LDVAVIGGGVIGLAIAWRAAQAGLRVTIADPRPGGGASHVAAGMIAPVGEAQFGEETLLALNLASASRYPRFIADLEVAAGRAAGYRECGMLLVALDVDENVALDREHRYRAGLGLSVRRLTSRECRALEPGLAPAVRGGVLVEGDHQVDPRALIPALLAACERTGVEVRHRQAAVRVDGGSATGVRLEGGGDVDARHTVLAAGCWSGQVGGIPVGALPRVRPVKGQILRLRSRRSTQLVSRGIRGNGVYIVPRGDGRYIIGSTTEEAGFDTAVTAGATYQLLRDAHDLVPDIAELELVEASAGLRPGTPDNAPLIGRSALPGLLIATGHHRNGFLQTPITAEAMVAHLTSGDPPAETVPFAPTRFAHAVEVPA
jgi:glycine oxidase